MEKQINSLISGVADYLKSRLSYSTWTVNHFRTCWNIIRNFMDSNDIEYYTHDVEKQFLHQHLGDRGTKELSHYEREKYNAVKMLLKKF